MHVQYKCNYLTWWRQDLRFQMNQSKKQKTNWNCGCLLTRLTKSVSSCMRLCVRVRERGLQAMVWGPIDNDSMSSHLLLLKRLQWLSEDNDSLELQSQGEKRTPRPSRRVGRYKPEKDTGGHVPRTCRICPPHIIFCFFTAIATASFIYKYQRPCIVPQTNHVIE